MAVKLLNRTSIPTRLLRRLLMWTMDGCGVVHIDGHIQPPVKISGVGDDELTRVMRRRSIQAPSGFMFLDRATPGQYLHPPHKPAKPAAYGVGRPGEYRPRIRGEDTRPGWLTLWTPPEDNPLDYDRLYTLVVYLGVAFAEYFDGVPLPPGDGALAPFRQAVLLEWANHGNRLISEWTA